MSCVTHSARCKRVDIPLTPLSCSHSALSLSVCAMLDNCHVIISNKRQISWQTFPYAIEGSHKGMGGVWMVWRGSQKTIYMQQQTVLHMF